MTKKLLCAVTAIGVLVLAAAMSAREKGPTIRLKIWTEPELFVTDAGKARQQAVAAITKALPDVKSCTCVIDNDHPDVIVRVVDVTIQPAAPFVPRVVEIHTVMAVTPDRWEGPMTGRQESVWYASQNWLAQFDRWVKNNAAQFTN